MFLKPTLVSHEWWEYILGKNLHRSVLSVITLEEKWSIQRDRMWSLTRGHRLCPYKDRWTILGYSTLGQEVNKYMNPLVKKSLLSRYCKTQGKLLYTLKRTELILQPLSVIRQSAISWQHRKTNWLYPLQTIKVLRNPINPQCATLSLKCIQNYALYI